MDKNSRRLYEDCFRYAQKKKELTERTLQSMSKKPDPSHSRKVSVSPLRERDLAHKIDFRPATPPPRSATPRKPPGKNPQAAQPPQQRQVPVFRAEQGSGPGLEVERVNVIRVSTSEAWQLAGLQRWLANSSDQLQPQQRRR